MSPPFPAGVLLDVQEPPPRPLPAECDYTAKEPSPNSHTTMLYPTTETTILTSAVIVVDPRETEAERVPRGQYRV